MADADSDDALSIDHDHLISFVADLKAAETSAATKAGERRAEIKEFLGDTGINKKAFSDFRRLDKMDPEDRQDYWRSFDALREEFDAYWDGQTTPDMFDDPEKGSVVPINGAAG